MVAAYGGQGKAIRFQPDDVPTELRLSFSVTGKGELNDFSVVNPELARGELASCLARLFTTLKFPASGGGNCRVEDWKVPIK